jgi:hypothetical protein
VELEGEIRLTVDELMREELKNLKMVMEAGYIIATHLPCNIGGGGGWWLLKFLRAHN